MNATRLTAQATEVHPEHQKKLHRYAKPQVSRTGAGRGATFIMNVFQRCFDICREYQHQKEQEHPCRLFLKRRDQYADCEEYFQNARDIYDHQFGRNEVWNHCGHTRWK